MAKSTSHPQLLRFIQPVSPQEAINLLDQMFSDSHEGQAQKFGWVGLQAHQYLRDRLSQLNLDASSRLTRALISFAVRATLDYILQEIQKNPQALDSFKPMTPLCFDKYLEYQYQQTGGFYTSLFETISYADPIHLIQLNRSFPNEVQAYVTFTTKSLEEFVANCTIDHPLLPSFKQEYQIQ